MIDSSLANLKKLTLSQASKLFGVTRQALWMAINKGLLKGVMYKGSWIIDRDDLIEYESLKYSRERSRFNGMPLYDKEKGELSIHEAARLIGERPQRLYYLIRKGAIPAARKGSVIVIEYETLKKIYGLEQNQDQAQMQFA